MFNRFKTLLILIIVSGTVLSMLMIGCLAPAAESPGSTSTAITVLTYGGSDPKGDYIAVEIDKTHHTVKHYNYTTGETNGPFAYTQATELKNASGFVNVYKAVINASATGNDPQYVVFAEFEGAAVVYQLFDSSNNTVDRPQYAINRSALQKTDFYDHAFNWMKFKIDVTNNDASTDMECGFAAWDNAANNGRLYGAGYSNRAEQEAWATNGISSINSGGVVQAGNLLSDSTNVSSYLFDTTNDMDHRLSFTGTPSGTVVLDFGPSLGGGSGLAIPQASDAVWANHDDKYNGTYFILVYEYDTSNDQNEVRPIKCEISGTSTGHIKVFDISQNTSTGTSFLDTDLIAVSALPAGNSPGGSTAIIAQFADAAGNASASSNVVKSAHNCNGAYLAHFSDVNTEEITMLMFDNNGRFAGFTGFTENKNNSSYKYRFGFAIKDPGYSNSNIIP